MYVVFSVELFKSVVAVLDLFGPLLGLLVASLRDRWPALADDLVFVVVLDCRRRSLLSSSSLSLSWLDDERDIGSDACLLDL